MDPDATLRELLEAVGDGDVDRVEELADALEAWFRASGFPPRTLGPPELGTIWHLAVTKATIRLAKAHVRIVAEQNRQQTQMP